MRPFLPARQCLYGTILLRQSQRRVLEHLLRHHLQSRLLHPQLLQSLPLVLLLKPKHLHCCPFAHCVLHAVQAVRSGGLWSWLPQMRSLLRRLHFPDELLGLLCLHRWLRNAAEYLPGLLCQLQNLRDRH